MGDGDFIGDVKAEAQPFAVMQRAAASFSIDTHTEYDSPLA